MNLFGRILRPFLVLLFLLLTVTGVSAQDAPSPIVHITRVSVEADSIDEYLKFMKEKGAPNYKRSELTWLHAWQVWPYGKGPEFLFATEVENFARFDGPHPLSKIMSEAEMAEFLSEMGGFIESWNTMALQVHPDHSYMKENAQLGVAVFWTADFAPGMRSQGLQFLQQDIVPAMEKAGVEACLVHTLMFGDGPDVQVAVLQRDFASLDQGHPVMRAFGPEAARNILARAESLFVNASAVTLRYLPDLSFDKRGN